MRKINVQNQQLIPLSNSIFMNVWIAVFRVTSSFQRYIYSINSPCLFLLDHWAYLTLLFRRRLFLITDVKIQRVGPICKRSTLVHFACILFNISAYLRCFKLTFGCVKQIGKYLSCCCCLKSTNVNNVGQKS